MWSTALVRLRNVFRFLFASTPGSLAYAEHRCPDKRPAARPPYRRRTRVECLEERKVFSVGYHGGAVISNVAVETLYYGQAWSQNASLEQTANQLNQYFSYLTNSSYMDMLGEYSTSRQAVGRGQWTGSVDNPSNPPGGNLVSDNQIQQMIASELASGALPPNSANQLIVVFTAPNVVVSMGGQTSASTPGFYGYHGSFTNASGQQIRYAVIANPTGNDKVPGASAMDQLTLVASHELAEAVTDPDGNAWFDGNRYSSTYGYEIGDLCNNAGDMVYLGPYAVQCEWSNRLNGCAVPAGAAASPSSAPTTPTPVLPAGMPSNLLSLAQSLANSIGAEEKIIIDAYRQYLNRSADAAGLSYWVGQLDNGVTDEQLDAAFIGSQEYIRDHGGNTTAWVEGMYRDLLGRNPDSAGLSYWTLQLAEGASPLNVALGFATSAERETIVVNDDYFALLGRGASANEASYWVNQLEHGVRNENILAGFVGSAEYYRAANKGAGDRTTWLKSAYQDLLNRSPTAQEISAWLSLMD